jgi:hypothetical protein
MPREMDASRRSDRDSEVKGVWFVSMRAWLGDHASADERAAMLEAILSEYRPAFADPLVSEWYPEPMLASALYAAHRVLAEGDDERFVRIIEGCTEVGVNRFFRLLLRLSSVGFVAKLVPTMWKQIRRGVGEVHVETVGDEARIFYRRFPRFADPLYPLMTLGSLRALVRISTGAEPVVEIRDRGADFLTVAIGVR